MVNCQLTFLIYIFKCWYQNSETVPIPEPLKMYDVISKIDTKSHVVKLTSSQ